MGNFDILAQRLKTLRADMSMTQKEFSEKVGFTQATLSAYENGQKKPSLDIIMDIAKHCNVSIDWLCGLREEKGGKPEIKTYRDVAVRILELLTANMFPFDFELKTYTVDDTDYELALPGDTICHYEWALALPNEDRLLGFVSTYKELNDLYINGRIKQDVIDTWLNGALEELKTIPIVIPSEEFDEEHSNILDDPPQS